MHIHRLTILTALHHKNSDTNAIKYLGLCIFSLNHNFQVAAFFIGTG